MGKVFDTCIFFNEEPLLAMKLKSLSKLVDVIVVAEGTESFTGKPHVLQAQNVINSMYCKAEVRHIVVDYPEGIKDAWEREHYLRNSISQGLYDFGPGDICIYGDVDEHINPDKLDIIKAEVEAHQFVTFQLQWLQLRANLKMLADGRDYDFWNTRAFTYKAYVDFGSSIQRLRDFHCPTHVVEAGWHFSSMGGAKALRDKLTNFAHTEYSGDEYADLGTLQRIYDLGQDFIQRKGVTLEPYDIGNLPSYIWDLPNCPEYLGLK